MQMLKLTEESKNRFCKCLTPKPTWYVEEICLINEWSQLERNVTKNYEFISNSQNQPKLMFFTPKRGSHSASSAFNVKKVIRCNYILNMKALAQILKWKCQLALKL